MSWWRIVSAVGVLLFLLTVLTLVSVFGAGLATAVATGAVFLTVGLVVGIWCRLAVSWMDRHDAW